VRTSLPVNNMRELIDYARANPGKLTYGSAGLATIPHLAVELLTRNTGTSMVHVPYPGAAPALNDVVKGEIDILVNSVPGIVGLIGSDKIKILAALSDERIPFLPDVPTMAQAVQQPIDLGAWLGMFGPSGLPKHVLDRISTALKSALSNPRSVERLRKIGVEPSFKDATSFPAVYRSEVRRWQDFAKKYGFKIAN
jgi:tripartite-type tricarboxylate transporter receptor subunit TctC